MRFVVYGLIVGAMVYQMFFKPRPLPLDAALSPNTRILAFGDSITFGTGATMGYPERLAQMLNVTVINGGAPGEISAQGLGRLEEILALHRPHIVLLCHGGNDILRRLDLGKTEENIRKMIDLSRTFGAEVVLIGVPLFAGVSISTAGFYETIAKETGVVYVPHALRDIIRNGALKSDHVHPNDQGYTQLALALKEVLLRHFD